MTQSINEPKEELSIAQIYDSVLANREIILTIPTHQVPLVRKSLANIKAKRVKQLKDAGIDDYKCTLEFITRDLDSTPPLTELLIMMKQKESIQIYDLKTVVDIL